MKKYLPDIAAVLLIIVVVGAFFFPLFYPEPQLIVTPDFGRSDSWNFSIPTKYLLWKNLQHDQLPLWTPLLGRGFPLFAEGQVGALFLPNLILFKLFDFVTAYNLALVTTIVVFAVGVYLCFRVILQNRLGALLGATSIALSGIVIPQLPHISLLQAFSLMPWILLATHLLIAHVSSSRIAGLAILLALQVFAGFPQAVFITILFSLGYLLWHKKNLIPFFFSVLLAVGLSAIQLLPSYEFLKQLSFAEGFSPEYAAYFSYPWKHLATLIQPFLFGNPKFGTYPHFSQFDGSIFWENSGFIGWVPIVFAFIGLLRGSSLFFVLACLISLLLMTGKHSPFYFIFSFWPLTLFRAPSRFIFPFVMSFLAISAIGVSRLHRWMRGIVVGLIVINTLQLYSTWRGYHLLGPAADWFAKPVILQDVPSDGYVLTLASEAVHNMTFLKDGWQRPKPYRQLRNGLAPDSNALWGIAGATVYAGRNLHRKGLIDGLMLSQMTVGSKEATVSAFGEKLIHLNAVHTIVSALPLKTPTLAPPKTFVDADVTLFLHRIPNPVPRVYLAHDPVRASTIENAASALAADTFRVGWSVLVSQPTTIPNVSGGSATIVSQSDTTVSITVRDNPAESVLVLADTYYPGWKASIDKTSVPVLPVNIDQRGIVVPKGNHRVEFTYQPESFIVGRDVSIASAVLVIFLVAWPCFPALSGIFRINRARRLRF